MAPRPTAFFGGSHEFMRNGAMLKNLRTVFHYMATAITPAMTMQAVGIALQYASAFMDIDGRHLDGTRTYRLTLPPNVPAKDFWSCVVYDPQTRSLLQTDQEFPSLSSQRGNVAMNEDSSTNIYFDPKAPKGQENRWIQTVPGKGWFVILHLYGPLEPWFDHSRRPGEIEPIESNLALFR